MIKYYVSVGYSMSSENEQQEMTMPLLAATTTDGGVFIAGQAPNYGSAGASDEWNQAFDAEGDTEINALFDNGDHVIVEILTDMGLDKKEKKMGAKMVSVIRIPYSRIHFVKAGYLKGIPASPDNSAE